MHDSFLNYRGFRYLWLTLLLVAACLAVYIAHNPVPRANGGTWLGYTLGGIGAALILWLTFFGVRKRSYSSRAGNLRGWLSSHVYLGTSLLLIVTLHTGFQFGWNIHTIAYGLMVAVILSGFFGVYAYLRYPSLMTDNRANTPRAAMIEEIESLDEECLRLADRIDPKVHQIVARSIQRTVLGGNAWQQLTAHDASGPALERTRQLLEETQKKGRELATQEMPTMYAVVDLLAGSGGERADNLRQLLDLLSRKKNLAQRVARDIQLQALMDIWLYFHVPITFALIAALIAHVFSVFFYW